VGMSMSSNERALSWSHAGVFIIDMTFSSKAMPTRRQSSRQSSVSRSFRSSAAPPPMCAASASQNASARNRANGRCSKPLPSSHFVTTLRRYDAANRSHHRDTPRKASTCGLEATMSPTRTNSPYVSSLLAPKVVATLDRLTSSAHRPFQDCAQSRRFVVLGLLRPSKGGMSDRLSRHMRSGLCSGVPLQGHISTSSRAASTPANRRSLGRSRNLRRSTLASACEGQRTAASVVGSELEPSKHAKALEQPSARRSSTRSPMYGSGTHSRHWADRRSASRHGAARRMEGHLPACAQGCCKPKLRAQGGRSRRTTSSPSRGRYDRTSNYVQSGTNGFVSSELDIADGFELSVFTG